MSDQILLAIIGFFSAIVAAMTALIGYLKVYKPATRDSNGRQKTISEWISSLEARCRFLEEDRDKLKQRLESCEQERKRLVQDKFELLAENRELRSTIGGQQ